MKNDFGFLFWIHLILIILVWTSPLFLDWRIIFVFVLLYYFQLLVFGDCIFSKKQFGSEKRKETFYSYYLTKLGFRINRKRLVFFLDYILPWILLFVSYVFQNCFYQ